VKYVSEKNAGALIKKTVRFQTHRT